MNEQADRNVPAPDDANTIAPLPGEAGIPNVAERQRISISKKGLLAVGLLVLSLVVVAAFTIQRFSASGKKADDGESKRVSDRPSAATTEPRRLEMPFAAAAASAAPAATPGIPAIVPTADEMAEPIGVRRTSTGVPSGGNTKAALPEDAPVLLVSTRPGTPSPSTAAAPRAADQAAPPVVEGQAPDPSHAAGRDRRHPSWLP